MNAYALNEKFRTVSTCHNLELLRWKSTVLETLEVWLLNKRFREW